MFFSTQTEDIVSARRTIATPTGGETQTYAGVLSKAPAWAFGPDVLVRLNGERVDRLPTVTIPAWDVCATGKDGCRHACCR